MAEQDIYTSMVQPIGPRYRDSQIVSHSHYRDPIDNSPGRAAGNSHVWGDASPEVQSRSIDALIAASERAGLNPRQTAHVLAIARAESGFNPDAAAGTTSAYGLGQFVKDTGASYGLNNATRGNLDRQADALVSHYLDNAAIARSRGQGEDHVYRYHHDGPSKDYGGLAIGREKVTPYIDRYESFVREHQRERGFNAPEQPAERNGGRPAPSRDAAADGVLRERENGPAIKEMQEQLNRLGYTDDRGRPLRPDGDFGPSTKQAVQAFQRAHGLDDDGIAGRDTLNALKNNPQPNQPGQPQREAGQTTQQPEPATRSVDPVGRGPLMSDSSHPDNGLFRQAVAGLEKLGPNGGFANREQLERAAGTMAYEARMSGLSEINAVVRSNDGGRLFAVQGDPQDPSHRRVVADAQQASSQPLQRSSDQIQLDAPQRQPANEPHQSAQQQKPVMV